LWSIGAVSYNEAQEYVPGDLNPGC
jgi:hypothetical protein